MIKNFAFMPLQSTIMEAENCYKLEGIRDVVHTSLDIGYRSNYAIKILETPEILSFSFIH